MMLTIHGLPPNTKFQDLKNIIKQECKITDFILSPLNVDPDGTKRVRIGLADDKEGNLLMKYLDRYRLSGYVLRVVPVGKQTIDNPQQNTFHDGSHQWTGNQQRLDPVQNRPMAWSDGHGNQQWIPNQQAAPLQMQAHSSFGYVQPASGVQQQYFHQQGTHTQNKVFGQQERFPQVRGMQQQVYGSPKDQSTRNTTSNLITPQRVSQGRPHVLTNVEIIDQHAVRQSAQGSRFQGYNPPDKPVTILKDNFQGPTQHNVGQPNLNVNYQGQGYGQQWSAQGQPQKVEPFPKHSPSYFDKSGQHEKLQVFHDQGGRRFSPQRDQMTPVVGRRVSPGRRVTPPGHRILPHGRAISPPQRRISPSGRKMSPSGRRISPSWRKISPSGRRISPPGRRISPTGRRMSPSGRRMSPPGHRISPSGQRMSPSGRRMSPSGRRMSPSGRRMSPSGRRMSPSGRRISPHERRISPPVRKMSPSERRITSPGRKIPQGERHGGHRLSPRRMSPSNQPITRKISPGRRSPNRGHSPRGYDRYSPSRIEKQMGNIRPGPDKTVRPAYEPVSQAQSQPMYPGGYPPNARENVQYPVSGPRQGDQRPTWQDREKPYTSSGKPDGDRRDVTRVQKFDGPREYPRGLMNLPETKISSPSRMSRSPTRRDRSPIRDRYRRHSPSPRSPRRSWALEKRRSPENHEAPPPPSWPIPERQEPPYVKPSHPNEKRTGNIAVWDKPYETKVNPPFPRKEEHLVHEREDRRYFTSPSRSRWDLPQTSAAPDLKGPHREPSPRQFRHGDRYPQSQREPKFSSRDEYESQHQNEFQKQGFHERDHHVDRRDSRDIIKQDIDSLRHKTDVQHRRDDYRQRFDESKSGLPIGPDLNREIEDVFKRAAELTKKTEEYQRKRSEKSTKDRNRHVMESKDSRITDHHRTSSPSSRDLYATTETLYNRNQGHPHGPRNFDLSAKIQYKRDKAVDEITGKMMHKFAPDIKGKIRDEVEELVKLSIENMVFEMFGDKDVSFIEIVIKFEDRYRTKDLEQIFDNVLSGFPAEIRRMKRSAPDESHIPAKKQRRSRSPNMKRDMIEPPVESRLSDWNLNFGNMIPAPTLIQQMPVMAPVPMMVPMPYAMSQPELDPMMPQEGYQLFLCKDNFQAFNEMQADYLKDFIVRKIIQATESCNAWAPDLTLRGLQNEIRYEIWTRDEQSKDWLLNMDFNDFSFFNVLVYTSEELWHERAAIWLPDHPRKQIMPPLDKLKLQNRFLTNVNIDKWKLVKQIVTEKGTRLYVDMPPSSARALETHKMTLSYELSKVTVFLKAAAVDKNAFDAGLDEKSVTVTPDLYKQNTPMPAINSHDSNTVKFCLSGNTPINLATARRIKESIIYNMYKYLQQGGRSKTDFLKYGFCKPGYFCVIPENEESRKWLNVMHFGKINQQFITVYGADNSNVKYISVTMSLPCEPNLTPKNVLEKLKLSNRGVIGLKFHLWKNGFISAQKKRMTYSVDVDLESIETLVNLKLILDYSYNNRNETVFVKSKHSVTQLKEIVNQHRAALDDKQEVVNMDISTSDDESVVCLD
ncbi:unnamed protein product [Parnassius apollo]|uniref:(apollo) hypothetical protein n=1 Tax=Parnassius apollo TaxID=110799 RepID=A0A8S3YAV1_PARAO|nr:unnamed protein product [Parnassius apollo]